MKINPAAVERELTQFIARELKVANRQLAVVGVSGGVDSAVVLGLCTRAMGSDNVLAVMMPYHSSEDSSLRDACTLCDDLEIHEHQGGNGLRRCVPGRHLMDITKQVNAYFSGEGNPPLGLDRKTRVGNRCARERMTVLYDYAAWANGLVVGTSNRSELLLGYGTLHGDMACDINPLGNLYKTQVCQLAEYLGVPESIREKPPSADLWPGQTDEGDLGYSYEQIDPLLEAMDRDGVCPEEFDVKMVIDVTKRIKANAFKSQVPKVP